MNRELNLLFPLDMFYAQAGRPLPQVTPVPDEEVPEPYRQLLVGEHDMTPTLAAFHQDRIHLRVMERYESSQSLARLVVLSKEGSGLPVEFGAIVINLTCFPPDARAVVLSGSAPLGSVLAMFGIRHRSCPQAFVRVPSDPLMNEALHLPASYPLYGRRNYLLTPDSRILADILELLPPHPPVGFTARR